MRFVPLFAAAAAILSAAPALAEPPTRSDQIKIDEDPYVPSTPPEARADQPSQTTQAQARRLVKIDEQGRVVSNAPIPDTVVNRERYGQPLSRAGRRSPAKGN